jgi:hypothetical protein
MTRRRFSERDCAKTWLQDPRTKLFDFRTGEPITLENVAQIEREHLHEIALGGPDVPENCRYSLKGSHKIATNGTPATTAGSSKNRIAKANNPNRKENFIVRKRAPGEPKPKSRWASRPMGRKRA